MKTTANKLGIQAVRRFSVTLWISIIVTSLLQSSSVAITNADQPINDGSTVYKLAIVLSEKTLTDLNQIPIEVYVVSIHKKITGNPHAFHEKNAATGLVEFKQPNGTFANQLNVNIPADGIEVEFAFRIPKTTTPGVKIAFIARPATGEDNGIYVSTVKAAVKSEENSASSEKEQGNRDRETTSETKSEITAENESALEEKIRGLTPISIVRR